MVLHGLIFFNLLLIQPDCYCSRIFVCPKKGADMLRQLFTNDVSTIKRHILNHQQGNGSIVVVRIAGWAGTPQVHDVREETPIGSSPLQRERRFFQRLTPLTLPQKKLEVQLHPHGSQPWHLAQALYLKSEEEGQSDTL